MVKPSNKMSATSDANEIGAKIDAHRLGCRQVSGSPRCGGKSRLPRHRGLDYLLSGILDHYLCISAFAKRSDIIVANRDINFIIQKSRSTIRWFDLNDLRSLEDVLLSVEKECHKRRGPLTRRIIVVSPIITCNCVLRRRPSHPGLRRRQTPRLCAARYTQGYTYVRYRAFFRTLWTRRSRRACRLRGQELVEARLSIRRVVTAALSRKECERAAGVIKGAVSKVLVRHK